MTKPKGSLSMCECGHLRLDHYRIDDHTSGIRIVRTFSECAIKACSCVKFAKLGPPKKSKPIPTLDQSEPKLFEVSL